jgi:SAM-dependent methyltransferase
MYREIRRLEARNWWFVGMRRIAEALLGDQRFGTALDLGCGSGGNLDLLERHADRVVACDLSPESIRGLDGRVPAVVADGCALPFRDGSFDLVNLFNVAEHVPDDRGLVAEARRVLRPGGILLLATSAYPALWSDHDDANHHVRRYEEAGLRGLLTDAGFELERLTFANVALLPPTYVVARIRRALKRWGLLRPYEQSLLDVPGPANAALTWLLSAEASLVRRVDLPAGVSLLVRARRP